MQHAKKRIWAPEMAEAMMSSVRSLLMLSCVAPIFDCSKSVTEFGLTRVNGETKSGSRVTNSNCLPPGG